MGRKGCPTPQKRGYKTYRQVAVHQRNLARKAARRGEPSPTCYVCPGCDLWHVSGNRERK